jgi:phosphate-selective porin OprO/OprP
MPSRRVFVWAALFTCVLASFSAPGQVTPEDLEAVKVQLQRAQEALKAQQSVIEALQKKLAELEAKQGVPARPQADGVPPKPAGVGAANAAPPPFAANWKDGVTTFAFPRAELRIDNRIQVRWTQLNAGDPSKKDFGEFRIRRFKSRIQGWAYTPDLTFRLQVDWANANNSLGVLDDASVNYDFTRGKGILQLKAGQFKIPMGRQSIAQTASDMFPDRSFVTYLYSDIRDVGLMAWGQAGPEKIPGLFEYYAGIFNGGGRSEYTNADGRYQTNLRFVVSPLGNLGYDEANPFGAAKPKLALGYEYEHSDRRADQTGWMAGREYTTRGYDLLFRWSRLTAYGEYFARRSFDARGARTDSEGLNAQLGFLVLPKRWEFFLGYWANDPNVHRLADRQIERGIGANWYFNGFTSKLQADYRKIELQATGYTSYEFRMQYQIVF